MSHALLLDLEGLIAGCGWGGSAHCKLARAAQIHRTTLYRLISGERGIAVSALTVQRLAECLGETMEDVFEAIIESCKRRQRDEQPRSTRTQRPPLSQD